MRIGRGSFELQLFPNSLVLSERGAGASSETEWDADLAPVAVGAKVPVLRGDGSATVALQGILGIPSGTGAQRRRDWPVAVNALADFVTGEKTAVSVNVGLDDELVTSLIVTPALSLSDRAGAYAGYAGMFDGFVNGASSHLAEAGITYLAGSDTQLDLNGGVDLNGDGWFVGVGVATRWGAR